MSRVVVYVLSGRRRPRRRPHPGNHSSVVQWEKSMFRSPISRRIVVKAAAGLALAATALTSLSAHAETTLERAKKDGYIRVGFANEAPFGYATPDGKLTGEAP